VKTILIEKPGELIVKEREKPSAGRGEVLIRIKYVGFCGSDLNTFLGKNPMVQYPRVPGHEISAEIMDTGREVPKGFSPGTPVTVVPYTSCGNCPSCRRGREHACRFNQTLGVQRDGAMQEYLAVPWQKILKAPNLTELELAMVEPLTVGFHAVERGRIRKSDTVMVLGCGMIGAGAIVAAAAIGSRVIAVDIDDHKLDLAMKLGAGSTINSRNSDLHERVSELTGGDGPEIVIEAAGSPVTYRAAIDEVSFTGKVVCIGYTGGEVSLATRLLVQKELDIMGSRNATSDDFLSVISYLEKGTFPHDEMITRIIKPEEAADTIREWSGNPGRVMKMLLDLRS
jgi:threonine dehydrogenase-like Zn-dependent dehydrogenase